MSAPIPPQHPWHHTAVAGTHQQPSYPRPGERIFSVAVTTHTGGLIFWFNQRRVIRGTHAQCDAALRSAQTHNVILGWWSLLSILLMNWIAIASNSSARNQLNRDAQAYAQWWQQYCAPYVHAGAPTQVAFTTA